MLFGNRVSTSWLKTVTFGFLIIGVVLGVAPWALAADGEAGKSWAVVIGIEKYHHEPPLAFARDDAEAVGARLQEFGYQIFSLYDDQATQQGILDLLHRDLRKVVKPDDQVIIYFSGHGVTYPEEGTNQLGYLMPVEASRERPYHGGVSMQELTGYAKSLPARQVVFIIDSCYSGIAGTQMKTLPPLSEQRLKRLLREPGQYMMVAGSGKQESWEGAEWKHGLFTYYLLEGLGPERLADHNDDQLVTLGELFQYVQPRVEDASQIKGQVQTPELWKLTGNRGELAFVFSGESSPADLVAGVPTYATPKSLEKEIKSKDGAPMVLVPAGKFLMGSNDGDDDEKPQHEVALPALYIDKYEVTTSQYAKFLQASGGEEPEFWSQVTLASQADRPVVGIRWYDANAYCERYDKRLPTEAEWEKAARGTDGRTYPWGNRQPYLHSANFDRYDESWETDLYSKRLKPVGRFKSGKSPYDAYNMAGNVWEWVSDWYDPNYYKKGPNRNLQGPSKGSFKVLRCGSWDSGARDLRSSNRFRTVTTILQVKNVGFRCAQDTP